MLIPPLVSGPLLVAGPVLVLLTAIGSIPLLARMEEPADEEADVLAAKIGYAELARPKFALAVALVGAAALLIAVPRAPDFAQPAWWVLSSVGVLLGCIDAVTTWLPLSLTRLLWVATTIALLAGQPWEQPGAVLRIGVGAAATGVFFWLVWRIGRGIGFGDVRLAPVLGAVAATGSWEQLIWSMVLGTAVGAVHGIIRQLLGRRGAFAYGPALLAGPYLGLLLGS